MNRTTLAAGLLAALGINAAAAQTGGSPDAAAPSAGATNAPAQKRHPYFHCLQQDLLMGIVDKAR
jgi:hypothetical protein